MTCSRSQPTPHHLHLDHASGGQSVEEFEPKSYAPQDQYRSGDRELYRLCPSLNPIFMPCCRNAPTDRFMTLLILAIDVLALEWALSSRWSSFDQRRLVIDCFVVRFCFFAICFLAVSNGSYTQA